MKTRSRLFIYALLFFWTLPLLIGGYEQQSIMPHDEGLYTTRGRFILETGNWVNPWSQAHHKTPGIYWLLATLYRFFDISETTVRLPSIIFSLVAVILLYEIGSIIFNSYVAFIAAAILNLQFLWLQYSRLANPDLPTIALVLLAILCLLKSENPSLKYRNIYLSLAGLCLGLAIIFRGFMLGVPLLALTPYLVGENRRHHHLDRSWLYLGFIVGIIPLTIWLYLSWLRFGNETFEALFGLVVEFGNDNRHGHSIFFYILSLASSAFPYGLLALFGLFLVWRNIKSYRSLIIGFPLVAFVLISIYSTRLHHYSLILYPFTALLSGLTIYSLLKPKRREFIAPKWIFATLNYVFTGFGILLTLAATIIFFYYRSELHYAKIALVVGLSWSCLPIIYWRKYPAFIWVAVLIGGNWLGLLTAVNLGAIGNYEPEFKAFIQQPEIAKIVNHNEVYLLKGGGETQTLFRFYLPNINYGEELVFCSYAVSEARYLSSYEIPYKPLASFKDWQLIQITNCPNPN